MSFNTLQNVWDGTGARPVRGGTSTGFSGVSTPGTPIVVVAAPSPTTKRLRIMRLWVHSSAADTLLLKDTAGTPATLATFRVPAGLTVLDFAPLGLPVTTGLGLQVDAATATLYATALYLTDDNAAAT